MLALLFVQAITNLYLPTLNADLINNGVVKGDTRYIVVTGAFMLGVTLVLVIATIIAVYWGSKTAMAFGRDVRGLLFRKVESFSQAEVNQFGTPSLITRTTNDVQQVQMLVLMMLNVIARGADHGHRRHHHGAAPGRAALARDPGGGAGDGRVHRPRGDAVPCRSSGRCRRRSTASTRSCARC